MRRKEVALRYLASQTFLPLQDRRKPSKQRSVGSKVPNYKTPSHMPGPPENVIRLASVAQHALFRPKSFWTGNRLSGTDLAGDCSAFAAYSGVGVLAEQGLARNPDGCATVRSGITHDPESARYGRALELRNSRTLLCRDMSTEERPRLRPFDGLSRSGIGLANSRARMGRTVRHSESDSLRMSISGDDIGSATRGSMLYVE